jgi:hypothetical protein
MEGDKTECNNYQGISLLSTAYKILSHTLLARLTLYVSEIIGDHQCGLCHNRSTNDSFFFYLPDIRERMRVQWNSASAMYRLQESL